MARRARCGLGLLHVLPGLRRVDRADAPAVLHRDGRHVSSGDGGHAQPVRRARETVLQLSLRRQRARGHRRHDRLGARPHRALRLPRHAPGGGLAQRPPGGVGPGPQLRVARERATGARCDGEARSDRRASRADGSDGGPGLSVPHGPDQHGPGGGVDPSVHAVPRHRRLHLRRHPGRLSRGDARRIASLPLGAGSRRCPVECVGGFYLDAVRAVGTAAHGDHGSARAAAGRDLPRPGDRAVLHRRRIRHADARRSARRLGSRPGRPRLRGERHRMHPGPATCRLLAAALAGGALVTRGTLAPALRAGPRRRDRATAPGARGRARPRPRRHAVWSRPDRLRHPAAPEPQLRDAVPGRPGPPRSHGHRRRGRHGSAQAPARQRTRDGSAVGDYEDDGPSASRRARPAASGCDRRGAGDGDDVPLARVLGRPGHCGRAGAECPNALQLLPRRCRQRRALAAGAYRRGRRPPVPRTLGRPVRRDHHRSAAAAHRGRVESAPLS